MNEFGAFSSKTDGVIHVNQPDSEYTDRAVKSEGELLRELGENFETV